MNKHTKTSPNYHGLGVSQIFSADHSSLGVLESALACSHSVCLVPGHFCLI